MCKHDVREGSQLMRALMAGDNFTIVFIVFYRLARPVL
jgi:hypothetical protein